MKNKIIILLKLILKCDILKKIAYSCAIYVVIAATIFDIYLLLNNRWQHYDKKISRVVIIGVTRCR